MPAKKMISDQMAAWISSNPAPVAQPQLSEAIDDPVLQLDDGFVLASEHKRIRRPDTFQLKGEMGKFLGDLQRYKLAITLKGERGAGKTYFAFDLANAFLDSGFRVGVFSLEQGGLESKDTMLAIRTMVAPRNMRNLAVTGQAEQGIDTIKKYADAFDVIIIDSWQKTSLPNTDFDRLRTEHPNTIWVVIFQLNAGGGMRNGIAAEFDAPVVLKAVFVDPSLQHNYVYAEKNRGNDLTRKYFIVERRTGLLVEGKQG